MSAMSGGQTAGESCSMTDITPSSLQLRGENENYFTNQFS